MESLLGGPAVVVGAGMGGLAAAGALARHFENVIIIERDDLPAGFSPRSGAPQGRHPHGLLAGGLAALEALFPGFEHDLRRAGAVTVRAMSEFRLEHPLCDPLPMRELGYRLLCGSRPLIERVLRQRVEALANVTIREGCRATAIVARPDGSSVLGICTESHGDAVRVLPAEMVVDASGRGTLTLAMLDTLGAQRPEQAAIGVDLAYASAVVQIPADAARSWKLAITLADPAGADCSGYIIPMEEQRWMVLLATRGVVPPVENWNDFLATSRRLRTPTIADALARAEPPQEIRHYLFEESVWRHFERLPHLPRGILPLGDAVCRFNPVHGQGMSVAAKEAVLLRDALRRAADAADPIAAAQRAYLDGMTAVIAPAWQLSAVNDFNFADVRGEKPADFAAMMERQAALFAVARHDPVVLKALFEVMHLLRPPEILQLPEIVERVRGEARAA